MKIGAIIAEYNPFHNGHLYQLEKFRNEYHLDAVIILMSGNFTQRGEPAWMPKHLRARTALLCGADLILELPTYYATGSAALFAEGSIAHLNALRCVDMLCFGCETEDSEQHLQILDKAASIIMEENENFKACLTASLKLGNSYPAARAYALNSVLCEESKCTNKSLADILSSPNNILALEYIIALKKTHSPIKPVIIPRKGQGYHSTITDTAYPSASALRKSFSVESAFNDAVGIDNIIGIPKALLPLLELNYNKEFPLLISDFSEMFAATFLQCNSHLTDYADISEDIANRMHRCFQVYTDLPDFLEQMKNKAYTHTRLSRCIFHILLNIRQDVLEEAKTRGYAAYARILGFRRSDDKLLHHISRHSSIPFISKMADCEKHLDDIGKALMDADIYASNVYRTASQMKYHQILKNEFNQEIVIID